MIQSDFLRQDVNLYREQVEDWKRQHEQPTQVLWLCEDVVAKASSVFERQMRLETNMQREILTGNVEFNEDWEKELIGILRDWLDTSLVVLDHVCCLEQEYGNGAVEGVEAFRKNVREARGILTPDNEFFRGDELVNLRDQAIDAHRSGQTEPLLPDELS